MAVRFEILSHAGLAVTSGETQVVCDPWIVGSTYWRSWWNYPPPHPNTLANLRASHIYLTHIHWDHFQAVTLRKFPRSTPILIPKSPSQRLLQNVRSIGFENVTEIAHGSTIQLSPGFALTSYHFSPFLDSAVVMEADGVSILNANDAKLMGRPLRQLLTRHARIDFVLRSHSSANARLSYTLIDDPRQPVDDTARYVEDFAAFTVAVGARYAVPFASNHCHLHADTWEYNSLIITPVMVREHFERHGVTSPELVIMVPGDSWSSDHGFQIVSQDYFTRRPERLEEYRGRQMGTLERQDRLEAEATLDWPTVEAYFARFRRATPWPLRRRFRDKPILYVLRAGNRPPELVEVDPYHGTARKVEAYSDQSHPRQIHTATYVFMQCITSDLFSHLSISKRVRYRVLAAVRPDMELWNALFNLYEYDLIPLRKVFTLRFVQCWLRRWREIALYASIIGNRLLGRRFAFATYLPSARTSTSGGPDDAGKPERPASAVGR